MQSARYRSRSAASVTLRKGKQDWMCRGIERQTNPRRRSVAGNSDKIQRKKSRSPDSEGNEDILMDDGDPEITNSAEAEERLGVSRIMEEGDEDFRLPIEHYLYGSKENVMLLDEDIMNQLLERNNSMSS